MTKIKKYDAIKNGINSFPNSLYLENFIKTNDEYIIHKI